MLLVQNVNRRTLPPSLQLRESRSILPGLLIHSGDDVYVYGKSHGHISKAVEIQVALLATIDPISRSRAMVKSALTISLYLFSLCL